MPQVGGGGGNGHYRPRPRAGCAATADRPSRHASAAAANGGIGLFSRPAHQFASRQRAGSLFGGQFDQCEARESGDVAAVKMLGYQRKNRSPLNQPINITNPAASGYQVTTKRGLSSVQLVA